MSTLVADLDQQPAPPPTPLGAGRSGPGRRAILRWAWRLFRREWRQQVLVLALIAIAVTAAVGGATIVINGSSTAGSEFGSAGARVRLETGKPAAMAASLAAARARFGTIEVISHSRLTVPGSSEDLDVRAQDPKGTYGHSLLALRSGRYPTATDEVALTHGAANLLGLTIGQTVRISRVDRTIVGLVENPQHLSDEFALLAPGADAAPNYLTLLVDHPDSLSGGGGGNRAAQPDPAAGGTGAQAPVRFGVEIRGDDKAAIAAAVLVAMTMAMVLVGLVAAAGFVVVAQRRQRQLGLLAALGATPRHIRLVMLANGAVLGTVAALLGATLGIVGWVLAAPAVETGIGHRIDRLDLPWTLIVVAIVLAIAVSAAAAWWPARTLSRQPVMRALSGRPARPQPVQRSLAVALAVTAAGVAALVVSDPNGSPKPLLLMGSLLAIAVGIIFLAPAAIQALAAPAGRLPFAVRLALRDLARYQARAAAAIAAITLGLGLCVTVVVLAQANVATADQGNLSNRQLLVSFRVVADGVAEPALADSQLAAYDTAARTVAKAAGGASVFPLDMAVNPSADAGANLVPPIGPAIAKNAHSFEDAGMAYVATPALLRHFGIEPASIAPTTDLLTAQTDDRLVLLDFSVRPGTASPVQHASLSPYDSAPRNLITASAMQRHGWKAVPSGWFLESAKPLTSAQLTAARKAAAEAGLTIEARSTQADLASLRNGATTTGAVLALVIVAMTIGLIRSEAAGDVRTLTATGAAPRTRRTITAAAAGAVALLGAILGMVGAYVTLIASYHADLGPLASPPIANLLLLAIAMPLVAAAAGWLLAGREPKTFSRAALD